MLRRLWLLVYYFFINIFPFDICSGFDGGAGGVTLLSSQTAHTIYGIRNWSKISIQHGTWRVWEKGREEGRKGRRGEYLYSSLIPYATTISDKSTRTALAAAFMRSSARRSFGFSKEYLAENLTWIRTNLRLGE